MVVVVLAEGAKDKELGLAMKISFDELVAPLALCHADGIDGPAKASVKGSEVGKSD